ncbi:UDP:flavonoid glycosyltransferase YjiC, YdhE family [Nonomuraea solani]|uniref:UDP:flavonoid glycosyltransferase YjiC, YdhE family n=1 Tax=Nonomuraea solani TaxID=1144553 RepID=A0A1H6F001_9ACTN|nr:glycosyltransferase [Nonomuraea solani]SEH03372.1 UDP:flavonoid glycosyltransferase YjiC, YdhE family [Nonomuraea solani]
MPRIIVAATPLHGHVTPLLSVAADLVRRGHDVAMLTGSRFAGRVRATGARHVSLPPEADYDDRRMTAHFPELATAAPGPEMDAVYARQVFADCAPGQWRALAALLETFPAGAVVADVLFLGTFPLVLGERRGPRPAVVGLGVVPVMAQSADAPPYGLGLRPSGRETHLALNAAARAAFAPVQEHCAKVFAALGADLPGHLYDATVSVPDHYLQLTVPEFEYPRSDLPASFRFAGPLPPPASAGFEPPDWWGELSGAAERGRPVVVVTQGTLANADLGRLVVPALRGLAGEEVLVVAATARPDGPAEVRAAIVPADGPAGTPGATGLAEGPAGTPGATGSAEGPAGAPGIPGNAIVAGYVPFDRLLPYADVLVTNGGYGGVHAAIHHGVPLVVAGTTEDKADIAARVSWSGAGIDLRTGRPEPEDVRRAVMTVLGDERHRRAVARLRAAARRYDPFETIARIVNQNM